MSLIIQISFFRQLQFPHQSHDYFNLTRNNLKGVLIHNLHGRRTNITRTFPKKLKDLNMSLSSCTPTWKKPVSRTSRKDENNSPVALNMNCSAADGILGTHDMIASSYFWTTVAEICNEIIFEVDRVLKILWMVLGNNLDKLLYRLGCQYFSNTSPLVLEGTLIEGHLDAHQSYWKIPPSSDLTIFLKDVHLQRRETSHPIFNCWLNRFVMFNNMLICTVE